MIDILGGRERVSASSWVDGMEWMYYSTSAARAIVNCGWVYGMIRNEGGKSSEARRSKQAVPCMVVHGLQL